MANNASELSELWGIVVYLTTWKWLFSVNLWECKSRTFTFSGPFEGRCLLYICSIMADEKFFEYIRSLDDMGIYRIVDEDDEPIMHTSQTGAFWKSYFLPKE